MQHLSNRLSAVAALVKQGAAIVDVGTDHGYIPVYLAKNKIIKSAVACDINEKPLASCKRLVEENELGEIIKTILSNGLENIDESLYDTVIIAGMGGELIAEILSKSDSIKSKRLILQPMTHSEVTRKFLYDNGFEIDEDIIVEDANHFYNVMSSRYTGIITPKSRVDYYLGNIKDFSKKGYFLHLLSYFNNKAKSGEDYSDIITALEKIT